MNYTNLVLFALGLFGILIHNLIKVDTIKHTPTTEKLMAIDGHSKEINFLKLK